MTPVEAALPMAAPAAAQAPAAPGFVQPLSPRAEPLRAEVVRSVQQRAQGCIQQVLGLDPNSNGSTARPR